VGGRQGEAPAARGTGSEGPMQAGEHVERGDSGGARQRRRAPAARGASWEGHVRGETPSGRDDTARTGGGNAVFGARRTGGSHRLKQISVVSGTTSSRTIGVRLGARVPMYGKLL